MRAIVRGLHKAPTVARSDTIVLPLNVAKIGHRILGVALEEWGMELAGILLVVGRWSFLSSVRYSVSLYRGTSRALQPPTPERVGFYKSQPNFGLIT